MTNYRKNLCELLGYLTLSGHNLKDLEPADVLENPDFIRGFIEWHRDERCAGKSRDYHTTVVRRLAAMSGHFYHHHSAEQELKDYADSLGGEPVRERKPFEDMDYDDLRHSVDEALERVWQEFWCLPENAKKSQVNSVARRFRDALLLGFLLRRPLRSKNIRNMRLGVHIIISVDGGYDISIPQNEMKNRNTWQAAFPADLIPALKCYTQNVLVKMTGDEQHPLLFPGLNGGKIHESSMSRLTRKAAEEILNTNLHTHDFRSLVVTLYLMEYPRELRTMRDLLGHESVNTTIKHYVHLTSLTASHKIEPFLRECCPSLKSIEKWRPSDWLTNQFKMTEKNNDDDAGV